MSTSDFVRALRQASSRTTRPLALTDKGRLTTASERVVSSAMLAAVSSGTNVRIDGMYPRRMSRQAESDALRKIFAGLSDSYRDYDVVMVSKGGKNIVNVLSRTPGRLTSVANMYMPANGVGDWFWAGRGACTVATSKATGSVARLCAVFGYECPEAMYSLADGSTYRDPVERVAFANRVAHVCESEPMPLRTFDAGNLANALSIDRSVVFCANEPVRSVMASDMSITCQIGDATVADVVAQVVEEGVDPVCIRYVNELRSCFVGSCAGRVADALNGAQRSQQAAQPQVNLTSSQHDRVMMPQTVSSVTSVVTKGFRGLVPSARYRFDLPRGYKARTEHARAALADATRYEGYGAKARPDAANVSSVNKWLSVAGVKASDVACLDERAGRHFMAFMSGMEPMTKSLQDWVEYQLDVSEGKLFSANHVMRIVDTPDAHCAKLDHDMSLADLTAEMRTRGYSLVDANGTKHSAMFVRSDDFCRPVPNGNDRRPSRMNVAARMDCDVQRRQREQAKADKAAARQTQYGGVGKTYGSIPSTRSGLKACMDVHDVNTCGVRCRIVTGDDESAHSVDDIEFG